MDPRDAVLEVEEALRQYRRAMEEHGEAHLDKMRAQVEMERSYQLLLANGVISGRNDDERKGAFRATEDGPLLEAYEEAKIREAETELSLALAELDARMATVAYEGMVMDQ